MHEFFEILCPHCGTKLEVSVPFMEERIKEAKIGKVGEVGHQLSAKQGPYYDRWKAAMEARGEQKRCGDCALEIYTPEGERCVSLNSGRRIVNRGQFVCDWFRPVQEG